MQDKKYVLDTDENRKFLSQSALALLEFGRHVMCGHALVKAARIDASHGVGQLTQRLKAATQQQQAKAESQQRAQTHSAIQAQAITGEHLLTLVKTLAYGHAQSFTGGPLGHPDQQYCLVQRSDICTLRCASLGNGLHIRQGLLMRVDGDQRAAIGALDQ